MQTSDAIDKIAPAFVKAQAACNGAKKASNNPHFKSKYADLTQVWAACEDALEANGLAIVQGLGETIDNRMHMDTMIIHTSGQWISAHASIPLQKSDPQGYGSATTYIRRYALAALMGIIQEDDDGNAASRPASNDSAALVSPEQLSRLQDEADATQADLQRFCKLYGIPGLKQLPASRYDEAMAAFAAKRAAQQKKEAA